jgi:phage repressor protein C with HTH and peptisase S24 domain
LNKVINSLSARLREARIQLKMSQEQIAEVSGLKQRDISDLEKGKKKFLPTQYIQYLNKRGIDLKWLFDPTVSKPSKVLFAQQIDQANESQVSYGKEIPMVGIEALAGVGNTAFNIEEKDIKAMYVIPDFSNVDFMMRMKGSSMYPKYNSGDVIACRILKELSFIQWGKVYVIATREQGILVKRLKQAETKANLIAVSDNPRYDPFEIPRKDIYGYALVIGVVRLE